MLRDYLDAAMESAHYEIMEDGRYYGQIPAMPGVWADGDTLEACRRELLEVAEDWLFVKMRHGDALPVIGGIDLNVRAKANTGESAMKQIELSKGVILDDVVRQAQEEDIVLTRQGHALALISAIDDEDLYWYAREHDPEFLASLERAREQAKKGDTISHEELKRELKVD